MRRGVALVALVLPMIGMMGTWSVSNQDATPDLSISLSSGTKGVAPGDALTYTAEIENRGAPVLVRVVLSPPAYVEPEAAGGGALDEEGVIWDDLTLASGLTVLSVPAQVGEIPAEERRATAVISVYVGDSASPIIRTAAADLIQGVDDAQITVAPAPRLLVIGGLFALLLVGAAGAAAVFLRRRHRSDEPDLQADRGLRDSRTSPDE
ncbi:hypothetical protein [Microbacterium sp. 179-I 3D4 NHS]|uniref:hypothetical protein n=1 Tax=Microbacterium sp. 179-I 3D4 NHS TaxID=3142381 RepID=UPI0039A26AF2